MSSRVHGYLLRGFGGFLMASALLTVMPWGWVVAFAVGHVIWMAGEGLDRMINVQVTTPPGIRVKRIDVE